MLTLGSIPRDLAASWFPFLAEAFRGRRETLRRLTHGLPEFVFWIYPDGRLHDARHSHRSHPPPGYEHIVTDEPDYGGFLRGRVVRPLDQQLIAVYCREEAFATTTPSLKQLLTGLERMPMPIDDTALVVSDNGDIYGTVADLWQRYWDGQTEE